MSKGRLMVYRRPLPVAAVSRIAYEDGVVDPRFDSMGTGENVMSSDPLQRAISKAVLEGAG